MREEHKSTSKESRFNEMVAMFERTRPAIERGLELMQPHCQGKAKQIWQELVSIIEAEENDIGKFARKLSEFNILVAEYQTRSMMLASNAEIDVI